MRVLFLTDDFSGASLCARLVHEGHEVRAHVNNPNFAQILNGWVDLTPSVEEGLAWVEKEGLIVCDDIGFGPLQDDLRQRGYSVIGGSRGGDRLECDRAFCQNVLAECGIPPLETYNFSDCASAAQFIESNPCSWVLKHNGHAPKTSCYVGQMPDGSDVLELLRNYSDETDPNPFSDIILQKRVEGDEIAIARYFNGKEWVGPIEFSVEHKQLFPRGLGPNTAEMGNLMWLDDNNDDAYFLATLDRMKPWLRTHGYRGVIDINSIVNPDGIHPLEVTARFGYPATQLRMELHESPWAEFLKSVADGNDYQLRWRKAYGIAVLLAAPPFPFSAGDDSRGSTVKGTTIHFRKPITEQELAHHHFESVYKREVNGRIRYVIADHSGYILHVTSHADTVEAARVKAYSCIRNIVVPSMYYREDIGQGLDLSNIRLAMRAAASLQNSSPF